jgi:succinoglycan biosynthesis transport protein ExoP
VELVTLRELERKATATRGIYEAFLTRSRETSERSNLSTRNVRVISPAEAPIQPMGPSRKLIAIAGMMAGLFAGLGLALLIGAIDSIRAYNGAQFQNRYPGSPAGGYPQPPHPGPGTPPGGPGHNHRPRRNDDVVARDSAIADAAAQSYSAARAHSADNPGNDSSVTAQPVRTGLLRPKWARRDGSAEASHTAPSPEPQTKPASAEEPPRTTHVAEQSRATGRNAQAFMSAHAQPQPSLPEAAPVAEPAPAPAAAPFEAMDPRSAQPAWGAYPAPLPPQAPYQPHPQPQFLAYHAAQPHGFQQQPTFHPAQRPYLPHHHPARSGYMVDPYAPLHPGFSPNHPDPYAAQYAAAPVYAVPQPQMMQPPITQPQLLQAQMMQAQPHPASPQAYQPLHSPMPPQPQFYPAPPPVAAPTAQPHPVQAPATPEPQFAQAPVQPSLQAVAPAEAASAAQPVRQEPPSPPASYGEVDRIRREMEELRSRIDGYGSERRRA